VKKDSGVRPDQREDLCADAGPNSPRSPREQRDLNTLKERFAYLDDLRESGATNMFGAAIYLQKFMACEQIESRVVLQQWMDSFNREESPEARAEKVFEAARAAGPASPQGSSGRPS
jgi:hypothetical protein